MTRTGRIIALLGLAGILLTGCAQPGQLGSPEALPAPPPAAAPPPAPPPGPVLIGSGRVEDPVSVRTPGPAVFSVETVVLAPGTDSGWHRHPGTEMAVVRSGSITVQREDDCAGTRYGTGDAVFVPDAQPHFARNDGDVPAELVVTSLLAPGAPDREDVGPAC